jgi:predicted RNA-binding protein YlqC (UPF0109 family)
LIRVTGIRANAERARQGLLERVDQLDKEKQDRDLRGFKLEINVNPIFHPKIIGRKGVVINKIRTKHEVQIQFPERAQSENQNDMSLITIVGYEANALAAKEEIIKIVGDLESLVTVDFPVDPRVHPRIIGGRGKGIAKIMEKYRVSVKFPKPGDADQKLVSISGSQENVDAAKDHILNLEEEYLEDCADQYLPPRAVQHSEGKKGNGPSGFQVKGGPWEAPSAPDTNDTEEFPSMGLPEASGEDGSAAPWGPRFVANSRK